MKLGLINSAWAQTGRDTAYGIRQTAEIGFDTIDIFTDPLDLSDEGFQEILGTTRQVGLPIMSVCCVALGISDFNPTVQHFHLQRCRRYLDLCAAFGAKNLLLVLGEYTWQQEVIPPAEQWATAVAQVQALAEHAAGVGVAIALELEPFKLSLVNTVDTMLAFIGDVGAPEVVRANVDISHLSLMGIGAEQVARLKGLIEHVHLSDCDGKVHGDLPPGRGVVAIKDYMQAIADTGYDGVVSIELEYSPDPDKIEEWVQEAYEQTALILAELGLRE
jgi:sugar phosphate isomerase/epimerase